MKLSAIAGQPRAVETLAAALGTRKLHHAWLFAGPRGVGKRTAAFALAAAVNCEHGAPPAGGLFAAQAAAADPIDACGACPSCIKMRSGNHPDLHVLASRERAKDLDLSGHVISDDEAADDEAEAGGDDGAADQDSAKVAAPTKSRTVITVRQVRSLEGHLHRTSMEGRYKVAVIIDADQLKYPQASNAFLKTLEEPPGATLIVLTTSAPSRLPATIRSRCQHLRFTALPEELVARMLAERHGVAPDRAAILAHIADGSIGRALALETGELTDWVLDAIIEIAGVPRMPATDALDVAAHLGGAGKKERQETTRRLFTLLDVLGVFYRDAAAGIWAHGWQKILDGRRALGDLTYNFELLDEARRALELNCSPQVTFESMFMKMRHASKRAHAIR